MKETTPLNVRVAVPVYKDQVREPFATLTYGNVTIELDKSILRFLEINSKDHFMTSTLFSSALEQIKAEMYAAETGELPWVHRDNPQNRFWNDLRNPLQPQRLKDYYTQIEREDE